MKTKAATTSTNQVKFYNKEFESSDRLTQLRMPSVNIAINIHFVISELKIILN